MTEFELINSGGLVGLLAEPLPITDITLLANVPIIQNVTNNYGGAQPVYWVQNDPLSIWVMTHNQNRLLVSYLAKNSAGTQMFGVFENIDSNTARLTLSGATSGTCNMI